MPSPADEPALAVADAHCHLSQIADADAALGEAAAAGVAPVLAVCMGPQEFPDLIDLRSRHPGKIRVGTGIHPARVPDLTDAQAAAELALVAEQVATADFIGEIGLDYRDATDPHQQGRQREVLERQLEIAEQARLAVNMHSRRADRELADTAIAFSQRSGLAALLHWFTHSRKLAAECGKFGVFISAGPSITYDPRQAEVAGGIAGDFVLVETDSPVVYAGQAARPAWAARVADALAATRGETPETLRQRLAANLQRYLRRS